MRPDNYWQGREEIERMSAGEEMKQHADRGGDLMSGKVSEMRVSDAWSEIDGLGMGSGDGRSSGYSIFILSWYGVDDAQRSGWYHDQPIIAVEPSKAFYVVTRTIQVFFPWNIDHAKGWR